MLDYTLYLWHVLTHRTPWLWRFHLVHHVDLDLDATTGLSDRTERLLSSVVATPRMHTIPHSTDPAHLHSNFSSGLAIWDRLHGTALVVKPDDLAVGVAGYLSPPVSLGRALTLPFEVPSPHSG